MIVTKNSIDLHFSQDGDFSLGVNGDLRKANHERGRVAKQLIIKRLQSSMGDWALHPNFGTSLSHFAGAPNTRETGELIKSAVYNSLMDEGILASRTLKVQVVPVSQRKVMVLIYAQIVMSGEELFVNMEYDLRENKMIPRLV